MPRYHIVYQTKNLVNGKIYVGKRSTNRLDGNYLGSGKHLKNAIKKYGRENFKRDILFVFETVKDALEKEKEIVNEDFISRRDTYNIKLGGHGGSFKGIDPKSKGKFVVRDAEGKCFRISKDDPRYLSGEVAAIAKGAVLSPETRRKMSAAAIGKPKSKEASIKSGMSRRGVKLSPETRRKIGEAQLGRVPWNAGLKYSVERGSATSFWAITNQDGEVIVIENLKKWCEDNMLGYSACLKHSKSCIQYKGYHFKNLGRDLLKCL